MQHHAIPTTYAGVNFRSRLEARWAAFFDLLGWRWDYEPIDLRGYIPDFIIDGRVLVEVKPLLWTVPREALATSVATTIDASGWAGPSLLFGARLISDHQLGLHRTIGSEWQCAWIAWGEFGGAHLYPTTLRCRRVDELRTWREAGNRVQWKPAR